MKKQPKQKIKVTFPNGESVCKSSAINTTLEVLRRIGSDRFGEISLKQSGYPLVSQSVFPSHRKFTKEICDGWYYIHIGDTDTQVLKLKEISRALNLGLKVESGTNFAFERVALSNRPKQQKRSLYVEFNDGTVFSDDSYLDTFKACIYKIGPDAIMRANNFNVNGSTKLITSVPVQKEAFKVGANQYLTLPARRNRQTPAPGRPQAALRLPWLTVRAQIPNPDMRISRRCVRSMTTLPTSLSMMMTRF